MNTLILLSSLVAGGTESKSIKLANQLRTRGKGVSLAYLSGPNTLLGEIDEAVPRAFLHRRGKFSIKALRNLRDFVEEESSTVILCMNQYPLLYAAALKLFFSMRPLKVILAINTTEFERRRDRWFMYIYAPLMRRIEAVVFGCKYQETLWKNRYHMGSTPSRVIYNGVASDYFNPRLAREDLRLELGIAESFVIGSVGRLDREKNQSALLRAVAELSKDGQRADVLLVGSGPERNRLEREGRALGIGDKVHFLGRLEDVRPALAAMDVFVLPSKSVETFSNAALEAMAMSVPAVLSNIGGASEMIADGEDGFLFEKDDIIRLVEILRILGSDPQLRRTIGSRARETVCSRFGIERMFDEYEMLLAEI